jgi:hypothetical protein
MSVRLHPLLAPTMAVLFIAACATRDAEAPSVGPLIHRPEIKVGDAWRYRQTDPANKTSSIAVLSVVNVSERAIQTLTKIQESGNELDGIWTPEWNAVATGEGEIYEPHSGWLRFPLGAAARYQVAYELRRPRTDRIQLAESHSGRARIVGWENVEVPAGQFRALKVEVDESFFVLGWGTRGGLTAKAVIWYSPEVKRWVKSTYEDFGSGPLIGVSGMRLNAWTLELIDYKVQ